MGCEQAPGQGPGKGQGRGPGSHQGQGRRWNQENNSPKTN